MNTNTRGIVEAYWQAANSRDWQAFSKLIHPALEYNVPQTREYIESGAGYVEMFKTWPGNWAARIQTLVAEGENAICIIDFIVDGETMTGISSFEVTAGLIRCVTDYWPEPYEPPPRQTEHMKRHAR